METQLKLEKKETQTAVSVILNKAGWMGFKISLANSMIPPSFQFSVKGKLRRFYVTKDAYNYQLQRQLGISTHDNVLQIPALV